ncbi:glycerol 3-phosphate dehydrogenase (NAD(P)+) [Thiogranum longum]|uniref:Glycerol-3-phosphate dehydrogenase [NAD(P)+] n=1 Tax=Thiogranum longum TaxID=1537524 RepID=A0A4R1H9Q3_9GAMM|nr:NAD(P)H-dependent glycerol-3-phosphate dehydrogenase [Thiogranum longum]TCK16850.1 glycerol 3-phosphate dehydrogenase (NAD(P)+) [Thiogranum longum]
MPNLSHAAITVLGAGSWGTALAMLLARNGVAVRLWDRDASHIAALEKSRSNERYLPGIPLPDGISPVAELGSALSESDFVLVVVPSGGFRDALKNISALQQTPGKLIWASKGLEPGSGKFLHQVVEEEMPGHPAYAALSGPSFALEVARGLPTAVTVASPDPAYADAVAELFHCPTFRAYTSTDLLGVELGGSVKNVLAIAAGISDGLGYGANARAALITRGLAEIMRLGAKLGGQRETFMGLAGVGDLVLTCTDNLSRNRRLGLALGQGQTLAAAIDAIGQAIEGLETAKELDALATRHQVDMPITAQVKAVLYDGAPPASAVQALLNREAKAELL